MPAKSTAVEEEKKNEVDIDKSDESDQNEEIDLDHLPSDQVQRHKVLGIDPADIFDPNDRDYIMMIEISMIDTIRSQQDKRKVEKLKRKAEREAAKKIKAKEEKKKLFSMVD